MMRTNGQTDGVDPLLDMRSAKATQVKIVQYSSTAALAFVFYKHVLF